MKLLLSAPISCPGAMSALRNHQGVLSAHLQVDLVPLEILILPHLRDISKHRRLYFRTLRRLKIISVKKILPYGENVIFASFNPLFETVIRKLNQNGIRPSFLWCSTIGQLEMTPQERKTFMRLVHYCRKGKIRYLILPRRLKDTLGTFVNNGIFFPYSIDLSPFKNIQPQELPNKNVDMFYRPRFGKNILNQIIAFKLSEIEGSLHINFDPSNFQGIIEAISTKIIKHDWLPEKEYYSLISGMDCSLQVTIGESFNYAVCERMALRIPVLTTPDIYLVSENSLLARYLCITTPDTPIEIANSIKRIVKDPKLRQDIGEQSRERIMLVAKSNNSIVIDQIKKYFDK